MRLVSVGQHLMTESESCHLLDMKGARQAPLQFTIVTLGDSLRNVTGVQNQSEPRRVPPQVELNGSRARHSSEFSEAPFHKAIKIPGEVLREAAMV